LRKNKLFLLVIFHLTNPKFPSLSHAKKYLDIFNILGVVRYRNFELQGGVYLDDSCFFRPKWTTANWTTPIFFEKNWTSCKSFAEMKIIDWF